MINWTYNYKDNGVKLTAYSRGGATGTQTQIPRLLWGLPYIGHGRLQGHRAGCWRHGQGASGMGTIEKPYIMLTVVIQSYIVTVSGEQ